MHGATAKFLADLSGGAVRSAKGTDGHGRGRFCARRVTVGRWGVAVSVVCGRGSGRVGLCPFSSGGRDGRVGAAAAVSMPYVCGDSCVVAGDVVAA